VHLTAAHSILRTIFVSLDGRLLYVVLRNVGTPYVTTTTKEVEPYCRELCETEQTPSVVDSLSSARFTLVSNTEAEKHVLLVRLSHAQYDGICIPTVFRGLESMYNEESSVIQSTRFEMYLHSSRETQNAD
jgi:brevianamide F synthase